MVSKEQRRRQLAREKFQRQQQRRSAQRERAKRRNVVIATVLAVALAAGAAAVAVAAVGGDDEGTEAKQSPSPSPSASSAPPKNPCAEPAKGTPSTKSWKEEPAMKVNKKATYTMTLDTSCGEIAMELYPAKAPHTVNSFSFLAGQKYFDHSPCHRLVTDGIYVLQCGDPGGGAGPGTPGYTIPDENLDDPSVKGGVYPAGTVAMANRYDRTTKQGRNTGGSQFFLVYQDSELPPDYTPFGKVTAGMDVLKKIAEAGTQTGMPDGAPNATVVIDKATVVARED
ncbi:peptidylprolyl isomerase [Wenjunlia vitaminophila]|uniref:Peptidylprolyl isomerase n=1 Tax=Wenjunlia vitaminophila TaxID=76728 RepID=A0A0T6LWC4_WENVI|nr:peptidylprolyl isomerase [Wenjunlia vitaminophila]KRV50362.1 peptidylprolyl isomerase [Wenjunlia vitaminophila]